MTIRLKDLCRRYKFSQAAIAKGIGFSPGLVSLICNHSMWPKSIDQEAIKEKIRVWLREQKVSEADIKTAFDEEGHEYPPAVSFQEENPMLLRRQGLAQATRKHFSLFRDPFSEEIRSHDDVFKSTDIRYVREAMNQTAVFGGFVAVIGESGAGKSTLRRDLLERLTAEAKSVIVIEPFVIGMEDTDRLGKALKASHISEAILNAIAPLERIRMSSEARFRQIYKALKESSRAGNSHVLIIEEAHGLPIATIKHLKRFYELEDGFKKLLSIILIGQPELKLKLSETNHEVREVVQRCEMIELSPLDTHLEAYLTFKFDRVGKKVAEVIDTSGIEALRAKLTHSGRRLTVSLLYPLAVGNFLAAAMNLAADLGVPVVNADVIQGV